MLLVELSGCGSMRRSRHSHTPRYRLCIRPQTAERRPGLFGRCLRLPRASRWKVIRRGRSTLRCVPGVSREAEQLRLPREYSRPPNRRTRCCIGRIVADNSIHFRWASRTRQVPMRSARRPDSHGN